MTRGRIVVLVCGVCALAPGGLQAAAPASGDCPYQGIIDRNVFGLKEPPPPPEPGPVKPPPPKITATGFVMIGVTKRALLKVMEPAKPPEPGKPPTPAQEQSYILSEGERQGEVEVLAIDDKAGTIKVNNYGTEMVLSLITNLPAAAPAPVTGPPPVPMPPMAGSPVPASGGFAIPATVPGTFATIGASPTPTAMKTIPARTLRLPVPAAPPALPQAAAPATPQAPALSHEEQIILMEVNRELTKEQVQRGDLPPLPPTELTPQ